MLLLADLNVGEVAALIDPGAEDSDIGGGKRSGGRHLQTGLGAGDAQDQLALGAPAGHDDGSIVAAAEGVLPLIQPETGLLLPRAMAAKAVGFENRFDVAIEVDLNPAPAGSFRCTPRGNHHC